MDIKIIRFLLAKPKYKNVYAFFDVSVDNKVIKNFRLLNDKDAKKIAKPYSMSSDDEIYINSTLFKDKIAYEISNCVSEINKRKKAYDDFQKNKQASGSASDSKVFSTLKVNYNSGWDGNPRENSRVRKSSIDSEMKKQVSKKYLANQFQWANNDDISNMRKANFIDMKKRQKGE